MSNIYDLADIWNDGATTFTSIKVDVTDTASTAGSSLMDLKIGGVSKFRVDKGSGGVVFEQGAVAGRTKISLPQYSEISPAGGRIGISNGSRMLSWFEGGFTTFGGGRIGFSPDSLSTGPSATTDTALRRDAAGVFGQYEGTNPQGYNIYNTRTDASNYERARMGWTTNAYEIKPEAAGTGTVRVLHISGLPTSDPGTGILWNDAGTVKVGA